MCAPAMQALAQRNAPTHLTSCHPFQPSQNGEEDYEVLPKHMTKPSTPPTQPKNEQLQTSPLGRQPSFQGRPPSGGYGQQRPPSGACPPSVLIHSGGAAGALLKARLCSRRAACLKDSNPYPCLAAHKKCATTALTNACACLACMHVRSPAAA